ncbi:hypothetical protein C8R47DRAFT_613319 [Mycena vitilis]|nr:hypothetical protein C8R47DRAFT_613319 [Mycena vitilis]
MDAENPYDAALGKVDWYEGDSNEEAIACKLKLQREEPRSFPMRNPLAEHYLTSNDEPKAAHIAALADIMQTQNATLAALRAEILTVHSAVLKMQVKRNTLIEQEYALLAEMHLFKGVVSPIRRLPPEILGEIFLYSIPLLQKDHKLREKSVHEHPDWSNDLERAKTPWHLGQICRYWRTVALSLRSLWSVFDLWPLGRDKTLQELCGYGYSGLSHSEDLKACLPGLPERSLASVENLLQRSAQAISCRMIYRESDEARIMLLCDAISAYSRRLGHLCLVDFPQILLDRFSGSNAQYEQLRSLALVFNCSEWEPDVDFQFPPCLTELSLTWVRVTRDTQASIPWAQLTRYCENNCIWQTKEDRWVAYRHLENAIDFCVQFPAYLEAPEDTVLIPKLQHARLSFKGGEYMLNFFVFPLLQNLSYDHTEAPRSRPLDQSFQLPRSLSHLRGLRLRLKGSSQSQSIAIRFRDILAESPELSEIFIDLAAFQVELCDIAASLTPSATRSPLCPKLEVLRLGHGKIRFFDEITSIEDMLRSRFGECKDVTRMRELTLYGLDIPEYLCEEMVDVSRPYVDEGVDIHDREYEHAFLEEHFCNSR